MIDPQLLAVARGDAPADLLLTNARVVNVFSGAVVGANVAVQGGRVAGVGDYALGRAVVDVAGAFVAPGFIDAHMHVESTMLPPSEFVRLAAPRGTTAVVLDPHEIANVLGIEGIRYLMDDAAGLPMNLLFALSSCVPATHLETSGARLEAADLEPLFDDPRVVALAEMMNYPGVVRAEPAVLAKVELGLRRRMVDGHAPGLRGRALQAYIAAGITSDHECGSAEEALEKLALGMRIFIREGSAARNLADLLPAVTPGTRHRFAFCTDDSHPDRLEREGHIDHVVRRAIALGMDSVSAIIIGTINAAQHYRLPDVGAVAPGYWADMIVFDDLREPRPRMVYYRGALVGRDGGFVDAGPGRAERRRVPPPRTPLRIHAGFDESSLAIPARSGASSVRVIGMHPHRLVTDRLAMPARVVSGRLVADPGRDMLKLAVVERHRASGNVGLGFVHGFGLARGAIASTVGHDSHNLAIVGADDHDMVVAARALASVGGGQCVVCDGRALAVLPLPIAGLMSDRPAREVIAAQRAMLEAVRSLGCPHDDPFMPLSFLPLAVIPALRVTDLGLVDVDRFEVVPLEL